MHPYYDQEEKALVGLTLILFIIFVIIHNVTDKEAEHTLVCNDNVVIKKICSMRDSEISPSIGFAEICGYETTIPTDQFCRIETRILEKD